MIHKEINQNNVGIASKPQTQNHSRWQVAKKLRGGKTSEIFAHIYPETSESGRVTDFRDIQIFESHMRFISFTTGWLAAIITGRLTTAPRNCCPNDRTVSGLQPASSVKRHFCHLRKLFVNKANYRCQR